MRNLTILLAVAVLGLGAWNIKLTRDVAYARQLAVDAFWSKVEEVDLSDLESRADELESRMDNLASTHDDLDSVVQLSGLDQYDLSDFEDRLQRLEFGGF